MPRKNFDNWAYSEHEPYILQLDSEGKSSTKIAQALKAAFDIKGKTKSIARYIRGFLNWYKVKNGTYQTQQKPVDVNHYIKKVSLSDIIEQKKADIPNIVDSEYNNDGTAKINYKGMKHLTNEKEALEFFEIDTNKYEIKKINFKSWSVTMKLKSWEIKTLNDKDSVLYSQKPITIINYGCSIDLVPRKKTKDELYVELTQYIKKNTKPFIFKSVSGVYEKAGNWGIADPHLGLTNDGNGVDILCRRFNHLAQLINDHNRNSNHVYMAGDFLESACGIFMHNSQMFETDVSLTGMSGIRAFYEVLKKHFFALLKVPLTSINFVAGNHDRTAKDSKNASPYGSVAEILYYFLVDNVPGVDINYKYDVVTKTVDGVCYIVTHGETGASKNLSTMVHDYGDPDAIYYVLLTGHFHSRKTKKTILSKRVVYEDKVTVSEQHMKFRHIQLPAMCASNGYAKKLGLSSGCGFAFMERSSFAENINHLDYALD